MTTPKARALRKFSRFWKRCSLRLWMVGLTAAAATPAMAQAGESASSIWERAANWLWAGVVALLGMIYRALDARFDKQEKRIESLEAKMPSEYERREIDRQRENITKIFDRLDAHSRDTNTKFNTVMDTMNKNHRELADRIADMTRG